MQQSLAAVQVAPTARQPPVAPQMLTPAGSGAQSPEQHCDDDTQVSSAGLHRLPPTSQRMAPVASGAHTPEQHWLFEVHGWRNEEKPSSICPLQLLSLPSQISGAQGCTVGSLSLQSQLGTVLPPQVMVPGLLTQPQSG